MLVSFLSPRHKQGLTTAATLVADSISRQISQDVILMHTGVLDKGMKISMSIKATEDLTRSLTVLNSLIENNDIDSNEILEYCIQKSQYLRVVDPTDCGLREDKVNAIIDIMIRAITNRLMFIDIATDIDEPNILSILEASDHFMVVLDQSVDCIEQLQELQKSEFWPKIQAKGVTYIVSKYNPCISSMRDFASKAGVKSVLCYPLEYNPFITKLSNEGSIDMVMDYAADGHHAYQKTYQDIKQLTIRLLTVLGLDYSWKDLV